MTDPHKLTEGAMVLACDARKALFLVNTGTTETPSLTTEKVLTAPETKAVWDVDRPGRRPDRTGPGGEKGPLSAMEQPDHYKLDADHFAIEVCNALGDFDRKQRLGDLVIAAAPEMLGLLRKHMPDGVSSRITGELHKDLTKMPVDRVAAAILEG